MTGYRPPTSGRVTLRFNIERYRRLATEQGWKTQDEQANGLGISQATVGKILSRKQIPGPEAIAALLRAFPDQDFRDLFDVVPLEREQGAA